MSRTEVLDPYPYNVETLTATLRNLGYEFYYTPETPTTMKLAEDHARAERGFPALFFTDHQTQGIGREGRTWMDSPGSSILATGLFKINPNVTPIYGDLVALRVCLAITDSTGIDIGIKYPNDLVINDKKTGGKKTGGILVKNVLGDSLDSTKYFGTMVGIGINVHYSEDETAQIPTDYGATALDLHTAHPNSRQALLVAIFGDLKFLPVDAEVFQTNLQFQQDQNNLWKEYSSVYQREVEVKLGEEVLIRGKVVDTEISNGILIETPTQRRQFNLFGTTMSVRLLN